jgi:alanine racemase
MSYVTAEVSINAFKHKINIFKKRVNNLRIIAVVKGNAYGHGLAELSTRINNIVEMFAVARLEEALIMRSTGNNTPVVVLSGFKSKDQHSAFEQHQLQPVIHYYNQIKLLKLSELKKLYLVKIGN